MLVFTESCQLMEVTFRGHCRPLRTKTSARLDSMLLINRTCQKSTISDFGRIKQQKKFTQHALRFGLNMINQEMIVYLDVDLIEVKMLSDIDNQLTVSFPVVRNSKCNVDRWCDDCFLSDTVDVQ